MRSKSEQRRYTSARDRAEKQSTGFVNTVLKIPEGVQMFRPKAGVVLIDILPFAAGAGNPWAEEGSLHWERTYYAHRGIGANGDTFVCPRMSAKQPCPVCEARLKMMKEGDEDNEELIKDLSPKQRQVFNLIDLKNPDKGVQIWDISYHLFGKLLDARLRNSDAEDEWDRFFHLENGFTLKVGVEEKSFGGNTYVEAVTIDFKPRKEDYDDDILEKVHCIDELLIVPDYDDLKKTFLEAREPKKKSRDEDEDAPSARRRDEDSDERSARRPRDEDEDALPPKKKPREDDDEPPARRPRDGDEDEPPQKKKQPKDEDDWGDFDEDKPKSKRPRDEDEDALPPKKKPREDDDEPPAKKTSRFRDEDEDPPRVKTRDQEEADEPPSKKKQSKDAPDDEWDDLDEPPKSKKRRDDD